MRIGIDIRNIGKNRTGDEVVFFNLVKNLAKLDDKNEYVLFTDIADFETLVEIGNRLEISEKKNFKIVSLKTKNKFTWNLWTLPKYLFLHPVDIYHTQYITPFFISRKIKIITTVHDVSFLAYAKFIKFRDLFFLRFLLPFSLRRANRILGVSKFTRDEILKYYAIHPDKVDFVYNAVADDFIQQEVSLDELDNVRKKYNLPEKFILYMGTLQPRKNLPMLVEGFAGVEKRFPEIKLVIVGNRQAYNFDLAIDVALEKNGLAGSVIFPGFIPEEEKKAFFKLATVFCFPSLYEGFGIPLLEAMVCGTPVVASKIAPHEEVAGEAVIYFDPRHSHNLTSELIEILFDEKKRASLVKKGLIRAEKFYWLKSAEKLLAIYQEL